MRAAVYRRYGPPEVVQIVEVPKPEPTDDEVLVEIHATTVTAADWRLRSATVPPGFGPFLRLAFGIFGPRKGVLGTELAGVIVAAGKAVDRFAVGEKVVAFCGAGLGCHAEYRAVRQDAAIVRMPPSLSFEQAAPLSFGGTTALFFLRQQGKVQAGERVLVNGASGGVGSAAVQLARHFGAEVTGVCSAANEEMVRSLGAADVVDHGREDFAKSGKKWDVVLDTVGNCTFGRVEPVLAAGGRLLLAAAGFGQTLGAAVRPSRGGRKVLGGVAPERAQDVRLLAELAEAGSFRAVIDRVYPFERIVEAHAHVDTRKKKGNVVVKVR